MQHRYPISVYLFYILVVSAVVLTMAAVQMYIILEIPLDRFRFRHVFLPSLLGVLGGAYIANINLYHQRQMRLAESLSGISDVQNRVYSGASEAIAHDAPASQPPVAAEVNTFVFYIVGSIALVFMFASAQMMVALEIPFSRITPIMYAIPTIVGMVFGYLIAKVRVLSQRRLHDMRVILRKDRLLEKEIADRKAVEEHLRASHAELVEVNRELDAFSYSVSHDLRSPLRGISGFAQVLQEDYDDSLDQQGRNYLQRIRVACSRMDELIDGFMALSRIRSDQVQHERVDLSMLATEIAVGLRETAPSRQVKIHITPAMEVDGDKRMLAVVVSNLLGNAWKFTASNPLAHVDFGVQQSGTGSVYFVRDNGVGFDQEQAGRLFDPFQRLHSDGEFEGTGIGLASVQKIIHLHGGRIWAEGKVGNGACFYFTLADTAGGSESESQCDVGASFSQG